MRCKTYYEEKECISKRVQINLFQNGIYEIFSSDEQFALNKYSVYLLNADHSKHFSKVKSLYIKNLHFIFTILYQNEYSFKLLAAFKTPGQSKMSNENFYTQFRADSCNKNYAIKNCNNICLVGHIYNLSTQSMRDRSIDKKNQNLFFNHELFRWTVSTSKHYQSQQNLVDYIIHGELKFVYKRMRLFSSLYIYTT